MRNRLCGKNPVEIKGVFYTTKGSKQAQSAQRAISKHKTPKVSLELNTGTPWGWHYCNGGMIEEYNLGFGIELLPNRCVPLAASICGHCGEKRKQKKSPPKRAFSRGRRHTLPGVTPVPSALTGLTSLFGMGRGAHRCYNRHKLVNIVMLEEGKLSFVY